MPYSYKNALRAKGIKPIPKYAKLRTSKADAKPGDRELIPNGSVLIVPVEPKRKPPKLRIAA